MDQHELDEETIEATLGVVLKYQDDIVTARELLAITGTDE
jgi:hypothetical protein